VYLPIQTTRESEMRIREHCLPRELQGWLLGSELPSVTVGLMIVLEESLRLMTTGSCPPRWTYKASSKRLCKFTFRDICEPN